MRNIILVLALSVVVSAPAQTPPPARAKGGALEQVQRLIYGSNLPPEQAVPPLPKTPAGGGAAKDVPTTNSLPNWDLFLSKPKPAPVATAPLESATVATANVATVRAMPTVTPLAVATTAAPGNVVRQVVSKAPAVFQPPPAPQSDDPRFSPVPEAEPESRSVAAPMVAATAIDGALDNLLDDKHKLAPGDKTSFQILEDRDPAKSLVVTDSGELDVPYLGRVRAADKTCRQLALELKTQLEKEYYYRASVVIGLDAASKVRGKIYIWGQVRNQGAIDIPTGENFTAGKAILRAGGFADFAYKKKVKLVRTAADGKKQTYELNMVEILENARMELDMTVQEDDFVIVPSRLINF
jgi:protein involved in polysaccharide export with SLBB domain